MVKRVGVIGGGQLAWMMAGAAQTLGVELVVQTPSIADPAVSIAADVVLAAVDDAAATAQLATRCDLITFENEFVDLEALSELERQGVCFRPRLEALKPLLDKYDQRRYVRSLGLPTPQFSTVESLEALELPIVLKARRHGYDGQGTFVLQNASDWDAVLPRLQGRSLLQEEFVPFERELAVIAARAVDGTVLTYPIVETQQEQQVCRRVFAPANVNSTVAAEAAAIAHTLLTSLQVVGVFGIELFLTAEGRLLVNEIAPRTHNSGHFTIDACDTSQFEQQLRAVCGLSLGSATMRSSYAVMVNLLGYEHSTSDYHSKREKLAAIPYAHVHWYGKTESRPGRKLGHVTVLAESNQQSVEAARAIESIWYS